MLDSHVAVANAGFVAVDFYDGSIIYDFENQQVHLCDLDSYRRGPYRLDRDRQYGSTRFMAPEEFERGATVDERTDLLTHHGDALLSMSSRMRPSCRNRSFSGAGSAVPTGQSRDTSKMLRLPSTTTPNWTRTVELAGVGRKLQTKSHAPVLVSQ